MHNPSAPAVVDMRDPAFRENPYPLLRALRERGRIERDAVGVWLIGHHADVNAGLRDNHLSREPWRTPVWDVLRPFVADSTLERTTLQWMLFNDPPKHTRLRRLVNAAFKPPVIEALRERITAVADGLLAALPAPGSGAPFDLMAGLAQPLPVRVICDLLGLPPQDFARTKQWSDALSLVVEPVTRKEWRRDAAAAAEAMVAYLRGHIASHRAKPRDDLLGTLIQAHDDDGALSDDELLGNLVLLFVAGHETTTNLLGNGTLTLLRHPEALARLRTDTATLLAGAVAEMLRYEGSVNMVARHTVQPYALGDTTVPPGEILFFMLGAANRDPAAFAEPDRFDIARSPNPHLAFGAGIHYCVGAPLARLEAEIAFDRLLARYPALTMEDPAPVWRRLINLRGLECLTLRPT
jgi:pimeloyl-[acyl-carrier protein] synthase